jgi:Pectate lyase superfamily protein
MSIVDRLACVRAVRILATVICSALAVVPRLSVAACPFNVSGAATATATAMRDAVLLARVASGVRDAQLVANTQSLQSTHSVVSDVLASVRELDVDASGIFDETDAMIVARYLLGFRGNALTAGLASVGSLRDTGAKVEAYIAGGCNAQKNVRFPIYPGVLDVTKPPYSADNTGVADASDAIRAAIAEGLGKRAFIYLPNGTYRITKPLYWKGAPFPGNPEGWWARLVFRGQSREGTILKLDDNLALFSNPNAPTGVIVTASESPFGDGGNNQGFQNSIRDLTINTGSGNPGAVGIDYVVSNQGAIKDVKIVSGDGAGYAGIRLERAWPGPGLIKNVEIVGFDHGINWFEDAYSMTLENITLRNQHVAGIKNDNAQSFIRNLRSVNTVPVLNSWGTYQGNVVGPLNTILGGKFVGGASTNAAIVYGGELLARDIDVGGYGKAIDDLSSQNRDVAMSGTTTPVNEYLSRAARTLFPSPATTLRLPIEETPDFDPGEPSEWANVVDYGAVPDYNVDSTVGIQAALNSSKRVVWFPGPGKFYRITDSLTVPPTVRMIHGVNPIIETYGANFTNASALRGAFKLTGSSNDPPLIFEHIEVGGNSGDGSVGLDHSSTRTVVWKHGILAGGWGNGVTPNYINSVAGGKLFIEDVIGSRYRIVGPQKMWARQLNTEYGFAPTVSISGAGANLWVLGWKIENSPEQPILRVANGATVEALGLHAYTLSYSPTTPFIENVNGRLSISYRQAGSGAYRVAVRETRDGETREEIDVYGLITLYNGYR